MIAPSSVIVPSASRVTVTKLSQLQNRGWLYHVAAAVSWLTFAGLHILVLLYFGASAYAYSILPQRPDARTLALYRIGMDSQHYSSIAIGCSIIAIVHAVLLMQMIIMSVMSQRFVFTWSVPESVGATDSHHQGITHVLKRLVWLVYQPLFSPTGIFGVNGPCFDLLLLLRELVETALQTVQAYRMSQFLARAWLNQFYVSLLVVNCWLMAIVHTAFHHSITTRYFVTLLCDLTLDFVSSMVVPLVLIGIYSSDADFSSDSLFGQKWFNDVWQMNAINEFQLILVSSWTDFVSRLIFSLSLINNLNTLKRFVNVALGSTKSKRGWRRRWMSIVTEAHTQSTPGNVVMKVLVRVNGVVKKNPRFTAASRIVFAVWGVAVLVLHARAASKVTVSTCFMQVRPWGIAQPSCSLVLINCHRESIVGQSSDLHERLRVLHPPSMLKILVRHCPALEMPPILQTFSKLNAIKIYNSSIKSWDQDAALIGSNHPELYRLTLLRVHLADGKFPPGLLTNDFPPTLNVLTFFDTNIHELPHDLDTKWPKMPRFQLAWAQLTEIPDVVLRMAPYLLTMPGNPISNVSKELFEAPGLQLVDLGDTNITSLPSDVTVPSRALASINLDGTGVSEFPAWTDLWLQQREGSSSLISAADTPYCLERSRIFAGELTGFTSPMARSRLMDASIENWVFLNLTVKCTPSMMNRFPIELEDKLDS
jgi:hypothetical protein